MNQFTILTPKRSSDLWYVTASLFDKLGVRYDPNSRDYTVTARYEGVNLIFKLGRPEDWSKALEYLKVDASITGKDLVVDDLCRKNYVEPKREWGECFSDDGITEQTIPFYRDFLCSQLYRFQNAVSLDGLKFDAIRLNEGKGVVILAGELVGSKWDPIEVTCWEAYRNLSELWLDENYFGSDNVGYRLIPLMGSAEGFGPPVIEFTRGGKETVKTNGIKGPFTDIMRTQAMVVCKKDVTEFLRRLYCELEE